MSSSIILKLRYEKIKIFSISNADTLEDLIFHLHAESFGHWLKNKKFLTDKLREIMPSTILSSIESYGKTKAKRAKNKKSSSIVIYVRDFTV